MKKDNNFYKLFFRFLFGGTSEKDNAKVFRDISTSEENLKKARKELYGYSQISGSDSDKLWLDRNYHALQRRLKHKATSIYWTRIAAVFIGLIAVSGALYLTGLFNQSPNWQVISLKRGEQRTVLLTDGTKVYLAPETTFRYPEKFVGNRREVRIEGEGFFEVFKDAKHPFIVQSPRTRIEVTGTSFNIRAYSEDLKEETMLLEGSVSLSFLDQKERVLEQCDLVPMQKAVFDKSNNNFELQTFNPSDRPQWMKGYLTFRDEAFGEIARRLERFFDVNILFEDSHLVNDQLNGDFVDESVFEILDAIRVIEPFDYKYNQPTNTISISASKNQR